MAVISGQGWTLVLALLCLSLARVDGQRKIMAKGASAAPGPEGQPEDAGGLGGTAEETPLTGAANQGAFLTEEPENTAAIPTSTPTQEDAVEVQQSPAKCSTFGCVFTPEEVSVPEDIEVANLPDGTEIISTAGIDDFSREDCSKTDNSAEAVFRCTNAVRVNPALFQNDYPCGFGWAPSEVGSQQRLPYELDASLAVAAQRHTEDQAATEQLSHFGSDGSTLSDRVAAAGFPGMFVGENVAFGYNSAFAVVVQGWMCSSGHRRGILNCGYGYIGVGSAAGRQGGRQYHTQVFGCKRGETCECTTGDFGPTPTSPASFPATAPPATPAPTQPFWWPATAAPTPVPTPAPTAAPTPSPTLSPTASPTQSPTASPTLAPTASPTAAPVPDATPSPTSAPTPSPTEAATPAPTTAPTDAPVAEATPAPTPEPTPAPTAAPTAEPTSPPTEGPADAGVQDTEEDTCASIRSPYCRRHCEQGMTPLLPCDVGDLVESTYNNSIQGRFNTPSFEQGRSQLANNDQASFSTTSVVVNVGGDGGTVVNNILVNGR